MPKFKNLFKSIANALARLFDDQPAQETTFEIARSSNEVSNNLPSPVIYEKVSDDDLNDLKATFIRHIRNNETKELAKLIKQLSPETIVALYEKHADEIFEFAVEQPLASDTADFDMLQILLTDSILDVDYCKARDISWKNIICQNMQVSNSNNFKPEKLWITVNSLIMMQKFDGQFIDFGKNFYQRIAFSIGFNLLTKSIGPTKNGKTLHIIGETTDQQKRIEEISEIYQLINNECIGPAIVNGCPIIAKEVSSVLNKISSMIADQTRVKSKSTPTDIFSAELQLLIAAIKDSPESEQNDTKKEFINENLFPKVVETASKICNIEWNAVTYKKFVDSKEEDEKKLAKINAKFTEDKIKLRSLATSDKQFEALDEKIHRTETRIPDVEKKISAKAFLIETLKIMLMQKPAPDPALVTFAPTAPLPSSKISSLPAESNTSNSTAPEIIPTSIPVFLSSSPSPKNKTKKRPVSDFFSFLFASSKNKRKEPKKKQKPNKEVAEYIQRYRQ